MVVQTKLIIFYLKDLPREGIPVSVVAPASGLQDLEASTEFLDILLANPEIKVTSYSSEKVLFRHKGVEVHAVTDASRLRACVMNQIREFKPTHTLVSSEDPGQVLLEAVLEINTSRVVYLAHTMLQFPFGPRCFLVSPTKAKLLRQTAGIITVSNYLKDYFQRWADLESVVIPFPIYGSEPFPEYGCFDKGFVTMINSCAYKGISIFLALARKMPAVQFAAVPT